MSELTEELTFPLSCLARSRIARRLNGRAVILRSPEDEVEHVLHLLDDVRRVTDAPAARSQNLPLVQRLGLRPLGPEYLVELCKKGSFSRECLSFSQRTKKGVQEAAITRPGPGPWIYFEIRP